MNPLDLVLSKVEMARKMPRGYMARCPAHDDGKRSLSLDFREGRVLINCFAGCSAEAVVAAIGLNIGDLFERELEEKPAQAREQGVSLAELAAHKRLPVDYLQSLGWRDG